MIRFYLNDKPVETGVNSATTLLDFIRYYKKLTGTKIGCREGDCGACTVLVGEETGDGFRYSSVTSCLMPIGNANGKHVLTVEGINMHELTSVQQAFAEEGATQCGFCTPGFVVSLTGYCMSGDSGNEKAIDWMNGNICRCTGYKSIERAAVAVSQIIEERKGEEVIDYAISKGFIPPYIKDIPKKLKEWNAGDDQSEDSNAEFLVGGGTDLYVQKHDHINESNIAFVKKSIRSGEVTLNGESVEISGGATVTDLATSKVLAGLFPKMKEHIKLISSTQIRNMATVAGNFTNASPIGDLSVFFLSLNASLRLQDGESSRQILLREFFVDYKVLSMRPGEVISKIIFPVPPPGSLFNFEKVSKRTHLDIASVNSAMLLQINEQDIVAASISAGGVAPVPLFLKRTSEMLTGKKVSAQLILDAIDLAMEEVAPISDARGSEKYKRLLLSQLIKAHFIKFFPELPLQKLLLA